MRTTNFGELNHSIVSELCCIPNVLLECGSPVQHSEDVLPTIHADKYYPCELVGTWNTWYGDQDQAGRITNPLTPTV